MSGDFSIKSLLPRTLFGRSLMILITPVLLIQIITSFVFFDRHWTKMTTRLAFAVAGEVAVVVDIVEKSLLDKADIEMLNASLERHLDFDILYMSTNQVPEAMSRSFVQIWDNFVAQKLRHELSSQIHKPFIIHSDFSEKIIDVFVELDEGVLKVTFPQRRLFSSSGYIFLLWMIGASMLLLLIAILFMRNQIRPIRKLAAAAERFGKGRDTPFFKPEGAREVRQAGRAFLDMRRRIERQVTQRTDMLAGVSHDLRTPLTRMKLQVEMMPEGVDKDGMRSDIRDMERMIHGYLDFVRGDGDEEFEDISLQGFFAKIAADLNRQSKCVDIEMETDFILPVRPLAFERAIANLVNNAAKYADHIWINAFVDLEKIQIQIEDNGPGIEADQYEEVFKPFTRVDASRNVETGGVGLGLPIAMDIVHGHGGKIWLEKSMHGGLCVIVRMPS